MFDKLKKIIRGDDFKPGTAVFPSINADQIASDLSLETTGASRGKENQPDKDTKTFDHVENQIIERVEEHYRKGLEQYENHRHVYTERLNKSAEMTREIRLGIGEAISTLDALAQVSSSEIVSPRETLRKRYSWLNAYCERNKLIRPAKDFSGWGPVLAIALIMIVLESALNSYLFSKGNEFGLLGGLMAAFIVSLVNVGGSLFLGYLARYMNHVNYFAKLLGLIALATWAGFAAALNLGIAHFRDGLEHGMPWGQAAANAVPSLISSPLSLSTVESWLLACLGALISAISFRKGWHTDDPYPGYGRVHRELEEARLAYTDHVESILKRLEDARNTAIDDLRDMGDEVRIWISDAISALSGQTALSANLEAFTQQCNIKTNYLLSLYRDKNKAARTEPAPPSFSKDHQFASVKPEQIETNRREIAEKTTEEVRRLVDEATENLFKKFDEVRRDFLNIDRVELTERALVHQSAQAAYTAPVMPAAMPASAAAIMALSGSKEASAQQDSVTTGEAI